MKKIICSLLLLILPFLMVITAVYLKSVKGPYWVALNYDPDYMYLLNSLNLAQMKGVGHVDNPGTTVQTSGAIVLKAVHLLSGPQKADIQTEVLTDPEHYLTIINRVYLGLNALVLFVLGIVTFRLTKNLTLSIVVQLAPFLPTINATFLFGLTAVRPEALLLLASLLFTLILIIYANPDQAKNGHNSLSGRYFRKFSSYTFFTICFSVVAGFGMATKFTFIPLLVIPLMVLPAYRNKIIYVLGTLLSFVFFTIPVIGEYKRLFGGMGSIIRHAGAHGEGKETIIDPDIFFSNMYQLISFEYFFSLILFLAVCILSMSYLIPRLRKASKGNVHFRLLSALSLSQVFGVLIVAKHFRGWEHYYLLPASSLSAMTLVLILCCLGQLCNALRINVSARFIGRGFLLICITFLFFVRIYHAAGYASVQAQATHQRLAVYQRAEDDYKDYAKVYYLGSSSPAFALSLGDTNSKKYNSEYLKKLYPDVYIYVPWYGTFHYWGNIDENIPWKPDWAHEVQLEEIISKHGRKIIFQGPLFDDLFSELSGDHIPTGLKKPDVGLIDVLKNNDGKLPGEPLETIYELDLSDEKKHMADHGTGGALSPPPPQGIEFRFHIDGVVDFAGLDNVRNATVAFHNVSGSGPSVLRTHAQWAFTNDDKSMYIAIEWQDSTYNNSLIFSAGPSDFDGVQLQFDNNGNSSLDPGEDTRTIFAAPGQGSMYMDRHVTATDGLVADLTGDGFGQLHYNASTGRYQAEFLLPMAPDAQGEDANLFLAPRYNFEILDHVDPAAATGNAGSVYPSGTDSSSWPVLPVSRGGLYTHPQLPDSTGGLIVFVSAHEEARGEIYTYDTSTRSVKRITFLPDLYKNSISLSHDLSRAAFHGASEESAYDAYEIYTVNIDGSRLRQLTNNKYFDGHPGWSPDDSRIVYASKGASGGTGLVIMKADGTEIRKLTPAPYEDGDPDYLPDGRIIFTTFRFSRAPQLRIAVMNEDGSNVRQLSFRSEISDHDPVGNSRKVYFERYLKNTWFATDPESPFIPWALIEVDLDTGRERTLLSDRWNNRLPVPSPDGQYIAYIKGVAHTAVHLIDLKGIDRGRLIPDITRIRYFDWK